MVDNVGGCHCFTIINTTVMHKPTAIWFTMWTCWTFRWWDMWGYSWLEEFCFVIRVLSESPFLRGCEQVYCHQSYPFSQNMAASLQLNMAQPSLQATNLHHWRHNLICISARLWQLQMVREWCNVHSLIAPPFFQTPQNKLGNNLIWRVYIQIHADICRHTCLIHTSTKRIRWQQTVTDIAIEQLVIWVVIPSNMP